MEIVFFFGAFVSSLVSGAAPFLSELANPGPSPQLAVAACQDWAHDGHQRPDD